MTSHESYLTGFGTQETRNTSENKTTHDLPAWKPERATPRRPWGLGRWHPEAALAVHVGAGRGARPGADGGRGEGLRGPLGAGAGRRPDPPAAGADSMSTERHVGPAEGRAGGGLVPGAGQGGERAGRFTSGGGRDSSRQPRTFHCGTASGGGHDSASGFPLWSGGCRSERNAEAVSGGRSWNSEDLGS